MTTKVTNIDEYIAQYSEELQAILQKTRETIAKAAPQATEKLAYGVPTFYQGENLVHFGAFKKHLGFFPTPGAIQHFAEDLKGYKTAPGTVHFPYDKKIPYALIAKITKYRVREAQSSMD